MRELLFLFLFISFSYHVAGHRCYAVQIEHLQIVSRSSLFLQRSSIQQRIRLPSDQFAGGLLHFAFVFFKGLYRNEKKNPIRCDSIFYLFFQLHLEEIRNSSKRLEQKAHQISNGTFAKEFLEIRWPLGVPMVSVPATRHDLLVWTLMNETHQIMPNYEENSKPLDRADRDDLKVFFVCRILNTPNSWSGIFSVSLNALWSRQITNIRI